MATLQARLRPPLRRGFTLISLLAWAMVVGFVGYLMVRILPTVMEFYTFQRAIDKIALNAPPTVGEIRRAFDKQKDVDYTSTALNSSDLEITKEDDRVVISFAYDKEIEIFGPVSLLIKYRGRSH